jgi:hypothetical protein
MATFARQLGGIFLRVTGEWAAWSAVAAAFVYACGYLSVRFKLTALGMGTDLGLLDERYILEGVKFLIYLSTGIPVVLMGYLPLIGLGWLVARGVPSVRVRVQAWWNSRTGPLVVGVLFAVTMIQFVMRQCFLFDNLLLCAELPEPNWFRYLLTSAAADSRQLFYAILLAGTAIPFAVVLSCRDWTSLGTFQRFLVVPSLVLVGIQLILLPANYAVLTAGGSLPRLASAPESGPDAAAWLIWEGKTGVTCLIRDPTRARLVTFPHDDAPRLEIVGFEPLTMVRGHAHAVLTRESATIPLPQPTAPITWDRLSRVFGLAAAPEHMRAGETVENQLSVRGNVVVVTRATRQMEAYTGTGDLRSPLFMPDETDLLALQDHWLVRIQTAQGSEPVEVVPLPNVVKLIGFDADQTAELVFLAQEDSAVCLKRVNLSSKRIEKLAADLSDAQWAHLLGESRVVGAVRVFVEPEGDGARTWCSIYLQDRGGPPTILFGKTPPGGRQPAISFDGKFVAFVRVATH